MDIIEGYLENITYLSEDTRYTIASIRPVNTRSRITVVGYMPPLSRGERIRFKGQWETHPRYGEQFRAQSCRVTLPETVDGIRDYLASGIVRGIGPQMSKRIVGQFGTETFRVIETSPEKLTCVKGIGKDRAVKITDAWKNHHVLRSLMQFLHEIGVKTSCCGKLIKTYGTDALNIIQSDTARLVTELPGDGFLIADAVFRHRGMKKNDPNRIHACILHILQKAANEGHMFLYEDQVVDGLRSLFDIDDDIGMETVASLNRDGRIVIEACMENPERTRIYSRDLYDCEVGIARRIGALMSIPVSTGVMNEEKILEEIERKLIITLSDDQLEVLEKVFQYRVVVITGGPGTGKTTLIRSITALFSVLGKRVSLAAPTGRAARRLSDVTGKKAATIHRLLGYRPMDEAFEKNRDNPLDVDVLIIDETSMVDSLLMFRLIDAVPMTARLVLVGDVHQLPSVGPGNVLADLIRSETIPVFHLKEIFRQAMESAIVINAHRILEGKPFELDPLDDYTWGTDFYFIEESDPNQAASTIVRLYTDVIPDRFSLNMMNDIQVLTPMHKGIIGTLHLNRELQKAVHPDLTVSPSRRFPFQVNDKVMHLKNNYLKEVFNGDIGRIDALDSEQQTLYVDYEGRIVKYGKEDIEELTLAYAISVHKSQGSEYPCVILPVMTRHYIMLQRNLLYTAVTRARKLVILIGTQKALAIAIRNNRPANRLTGLSGRLQMG